MKNHINKLNHIENLSIKENVPLKDYTTMQVGGPADLFLTPKSEKALIKLIKLITNINKPYFVLGKGSNIIVGDKGYRGIIIYTGSFNKITFNNNNIIAQSGSTLKDLADIAQRHSLAGMEFASGIPGSLGGAIYMNAGAYGGEMKDIIKKVLILNNNGQKNMLKKNNLNLSYRNSIFHNKKYIILNALIELHKADKIQINKKMQKLNKKRKNKQPLEYPSAGSFFKRPDNHYTGPLIEKANMKGYQIGGAKVSEKHAGFIINTGDATAKDIIKLIQKIQKEVYALSGVKLKPEPKFIGQF